MYRPLVTAKTIEEQRTLLNTDLFTARNEVIKAQIIKDLGGMNSLTEIKEVIEYLIIHSNIHFNN